MKRSILSILALAALTVGCTGTQRAYDGPSRPSEEVALVKTHGVTLEQVNGIKVSSAADAAEVLPGTNTAKVSINGGNYGLQTEDPGIYTIDFTAEPGKNYIITGYRGDGRLCVWERMEETGGADRTTKPAGCSVPPITTVESTQGSAVYGTTPGTDVAPHTWTR